jgi:hypothetical protein
VNNEVMILREVVVKITQLLAGMGLKVTQRGTKAFVGTCKRTHKPEVVNIPYLPDNASKELILAIQGFIDHEVAHILETDFSVHAAIDKVTKDYPHLRAIWNTLEDTFIERQMARRFAGSGYNLERLHEFFLSDITTPVYTAALAKGDADTAFSALFVPAFRAYSGQRLFQDFMKAGRFDADPVLGPKFARIAPFAAEVPKLKSTWECFELAKQISEALKAPPPPPAPPQPAPPPPPSEDEEQPENEPQGENGGEGDTPEDEGKGPAEEPQDDTQDDASEDEQSDAAGEEKDADADVSGDEAGGDEASEEEDEGEGASADGDDGDAADAAGEAEGAGEDDTGEPGDGASDDGDDADQDAEADAEGDGAGAPEEAGDDQEGAGDEDEGEVGAAGAPGEDQEPGDEGSEGDDDASAEAGGDGAGQDAQEDPGEAEPGEGDAPGSAGAGEEDAADDQAGLSEAEEPQKGQGNEDPNAGGPVGLVGGAIDYEELLAAKIGEDVRDMTATAPYRIYTRDFDKVEPFPTDMKNYQDRWLTDLDERTRQSVGVMQKDIQRMMAARSQSVKVPGFRTGRLHTAGLHRLAAGDDRVFRRLHVNESKDVAVELLIDNSGSMQGIKMDTAMEAGYALSSTLERVGIQHEVIGFTTIWQPWLPESMETRQAAADSGIPYSRYEPIYMPVYKGFDERLTSEVKRRFAAAPHQDFMGSNVDGESIEMAAWRLMRRKETRKVLIVLSDGNPICDGDIKALRLHLKETVQAVEKRGIETIGIGILTDAPRHYYPKFALLNNAADLPKCVMGELKRILLS